MDTPLSQILTQKGSQIHKVKTTASVLDAVRLMNSHNIGSLMVFDGDRSVGIFTERDVLTRVIDAVRDPAQTPVGEVMTPQPKCVGQETTLSQAMSVMRKHRFRRPGTGDRTADQLHCRQLLSSRPLRSTGNPRPAVTPRCHAT